MAQQVDPRSIGDAVELLKENGFDALAEAVTVLLNSAMLVERSEYLGAGPYERTASRIGYANGFKGKTVKTRLGELALKVPQTRDGEFYPQGLEKGLRSECALLLAIAEMYVQGVSTRRVKRVVGSRSPLASLSLWLEGPWPAWRGTHRQRRSRGAEGGSQGGFWQRAVATTVPLPSPAECGPVRAYTGDARGSRGGHSIDFQCARSGGSGACAVEVSDPLRENSTEAGEVG